MNIYVVAEGKTERYVYKKWFEHFLPNYKLVSMPEQATDNCYYIISGIGYPNIKKEVTNAIKTMKELGTYQQLLVIVDSDGEPFHDKYTEFKTLADEHILASIDFDIIVQNICIETWFLGNVKAVPAQPTDSEACSHISFYNVRENDPELMKKPENFIGSFANYHYQYLKCLLKHNNISYSKTIPNSVYELHYYRQLQNRIATTGHINSFSQVETFFNKINQL